MNNIENNKVNNEYNVNSCVNLIKYVLPDSLQVNISDLDSLVKDTIYRYQLNKLYNFRITNILLLYSLVLDDDEKFLSTVNDALIYLYPNYQVQTEFNDKIISIINYLANYKLFDKIISSKLLTTLVENYTSEVTTELFIKYYKYLCNLKNIKDKRINELKTISKDNKEIIIKN